MFETTQYFRTCKTMELKANLWQKVSSVDYSVKANVNLLMHNAPKRSDTLKNFSANAARFLKCVWPFWDIIHKDLISINKIQQLFIYGANISLIIGIKTKQIFLIKKMINGYCSV